MPFTTVLSRTQFSRLQPPNLLQLPNLKLLKAKAPRTQPSQTHASQTHACDPQGHDTQNSRTLNWRTQTSGTLGTRSHFTRFPACDYRQLLSGVFLGFLATQVGCQAAKPVDSSSNGLVSQIDTTPIGTLQKRPSPTKEAIVYLQGTIGRRAPLLQGTMYELKDPTGSVWVRVQGMVPQADAKVTIKGTTRYQVIDQNGQSQKSLFIEQVELLKTQAPNQG